MPPENAHRPQFAVTIATQSLFPYQNQSCLKKWTLVTVLGQIPENV